ncbi:hypothetical protein [Lysinibacillus pakistanensis]|uniref:Uncharacterized protein n=1 Tax=Lysinibacillus pakistanensis TaxID=759811 RepID=A0AAX3X090_9BACI|nr:hypothetical protein [Lysinibacillus pakistanensis]MDM5233057.1 hypothetical protein [Lysinibacillus pakistanensis]WHY48543.1 hypothetical protein QNH22_10095 [Lysinibacillus pakistanensis]WHY53556.1 hypothetical protein QNH24_10080 [Lysinibacillus pakistanensis]
MRFLTWGVIGAVILGVARGFQNGNLQQFTNNISNKLNLQNAQQMTQPLQAVANNLTGNSSKQ